MIKYLCLFLLLTSCEKDALSTERTDNVNYKVDFLFEVDGVKVYRFYDGRYHYFTSKGETIVTHPQVQQIGKQTYMTYRDENINGS